MEPVALDILKVALSEFANFGLAGARVDAIVARTQTSKRMVYYHFGSKEGLYKAVLEYAYRAVREPGPFAIPHGTAPLQAIGLLAAQAFDSFCAQPDFVRLTLQENLQGAPYLRASPEIVQLNRAGLAGLKHIVHAGQADGTLRPELRAIDVYINFVGLCSYHISARNSYQAVFGVDLAEPAQAQARRAAIVDTLIRYVRADPHP